MLIRNTQRCVNLVAFQGRERCGAVLPYETWRETLPVRRPSPPPSGGAG